MKYTDRSRYQAGWRCMRERFLNYHFNTKGLYRKGTTVPLATGSYTHLALELIMKWAQDRQLQGIESYQILHESKPIVRNSILEATTKYTEEIDERGWKDLGEGADELEYIIAEQTTLVSGLVYIWSKTLFPWVVNTHEIIAVEKEYELILGCTCGLGSLGSHDDHQKKGCEGLCLMTRPDLIIREWEGSRDYSYVEFKTGSGVNYSNWDSQFYDNLQFAMGCQAAARALDTNIEKMYVHGLHKGSRRIDNDTGLRRQLSGLCYAFYREANPPMLEMDTSPTYYKTVDGKKYGCTANRMYQKNFPVWDIPFDPDEEGQPYYETYIDNFSEKQLNDHIKLVGPINNNNWLLEKLMEEMIHEEERWVERETYLSEVWEQTGRDFSNEDYQLALNQVVPRSWDCKRFGEQNQCSYIPICFEHEGWDLIGHELGDKFLSRDEPNHPIELERFEV